MKIFLLIFFLLFSSYSVAGMDKASAAYGNGDYKTAFRETIVPAEQGLAVAQFNLGVMYEKGQGTLQDDEKAIFWYTKSADQANANAQFNLGNMYYEGLGVPQDYKAAIHWYRKSAEQFTSWLHLWQRPRQHPSSQDADTKHAQGWQVQ